MDGRALSGVKSWELLLFLFYSKSEACLKLLLSLKHLFPASTSSYSYLLLLLCQSNNLNPITLRLDFSNLKDLRFSDGTLYFRGAIDVLYLIGSLPSYFKKPGTRRRVDYQLNLIFWITSIFQWWSVIYKSNFLLTHTE